MYRLAVLIPLQHVRLALELPSSRFDKYTYWCNT
jgi:hypothetical protein